MIARRGCRSSQDLFTRMWLVLLVVGRWRMLGIASRWRTARPAERLLVLWVLVGFAELVVHDAGNERRYVMFVPALIALAALLAGSARDRCSSQHLACRQAG